VQTCIWSSRCYCHSLSLASDKIQIGFTFLVPAHTGSLRQRAVKSCMCVCSRTFGGYVSPVYRDCGVYRSEVSLFSVACSVSSFTVSCLRCCVGGKCPKSSRVGSAVYKPQISWQSSPTAATLLYSTLTARLSSLGYKNFMTFAGLSRTPEAFFHDPVVSQQCLNMETYSSY